MNSHILSSSFSGSDGPDGPDGPDGHSGPDGYGEEAESLSSAPEEKAGTEAAAGVGGQTHDRRGHELARFPLEDAALALLLRGPDHGYDLYRVFTRELGTVWQVGRSRLYSVLASLADGGFVEVTLEPQTDKPPRKVFSLTDAGRRRARRWLTTPVGPPRRIRVEFIAKLALILSLELPGAEDLLDAQIRTCEEALSWAGADSEAQAPSRAVADSGVVDDSRVGADSGAGAGKSRHAQRDGGAGAAAGTSHVERLTWSYRQEQIMAMLKWLRDRRAELAAQPQAHRGHG
jgi:DNA-binding PadR family transcriptional regulator